MDATRGRNEGTHCAAPRGCSGRRGVALLALSSGATVFSACHARSSMIGRRCTTTVRKLPITSPKTIAKPYCAASGKALNAEP